VKYAWIEAHSDIFKNVSWMCRQLGVSRTGYCQWQVRAPSERALANASLDAQVAAVHAASGQSYGRPRIVRDLHAQGVQVGHERVRKSLHRQALHPVYKRSYKVTTDSDRGSQYASEDHRRLIEDYGMIQSMSRKGNCWDNAPMESFFKTLKVERVHRLRCHASRREAGHRRLD